MGEDAFDLVGDPAVIAEIVKLAKAQGLRVSKPMHTESMSDGLDAPFGADEIRQVCEVITVVMGAGSSVVTFMSAVKMLLGHSETTSGSPPAVDVLKTQSQTKIGRIAEDVDLASMQF